MEAQPCPGKTAASQLTVLHGVTEGPLGPLPLGRAPGDMSHLGPPAEFAGPPHAN